VGSYTGQVLRESLVRWEDNFRLNLRDSVSCEGWRYLKVSQDRVHWRTLVLPVLNLRIMLLQCQFVVYEFIALSRKTKYGQISLDRNNCY
jgi:hypothetical protein